MEKPTSGGAPKPGAGKPWDQDAWRNGTVGSGRMPGPGTDTETARRIVPNQFNTQRDPNNPIVGPGGLPPTSFDDLDSDIKYDDAKAFRKQMMEINQALRQAKAGDNTAEVKKLTEKLAKISDVTSALKSGFDLKEAKDFARKEQTVRSTAIETSDRKAKEQQTKYEKQAEEMAKKVNAAYEQKDRENKQRELEALYKDVRFGNLPSSVLPKDFKPGATQYNGPLAQDPNPAARPSILKPGGKPKPVIEPMGAPVRPNATRPDLPQPASGQRPVYRPYANEQGAWGSDGNFKPGNSSQSTPAGRPPLSGGATNPTGSSSLPTSGARPRPPGGPTQSLDSLVQQAVKEGPQGAAAAKLAQRAAAGDPQAASIVASFDRDRKLMNDLADSQRLKDLDKFQNAKEPSNSSLPPAGSPISGKPGAVADGKGGFKYPNGVQSSGFMYPDEYKKDYSEPSKAPKRGESQSVRDPAPVPPIIVPPKVTNAQQFNQIRANQAAANASNQRPRMSAAAQKVHQDAVNRMNQRAQANNAIQNLGYKNMEDFQKQGGKLLNGKDATGTGGSRGGGRGGSKGRGPTAKERNDAAKAAADKAAEREDRKRTEQSYREKYGALTTPSSRKFWDDVAKRKAGQPFSGDSTKSSGSSSAGGTGTGWMGGHQTWSGYGDEWMAEAKKRRSAGDEAGARQAEQTAQTWYDKDKQPKLADKKPKPSQQNSPSMAPTSDPADIGVNIGGPDTSVPGINWQPTTSASSASSGGTWITKDGRKILIS